MPELSVVIVAQDSEQRAILQVLVDGTSVARTVHSCASFPVVATDPVKPLCSPLAAWPSRRQS